MHRILAPFAAIVQVANAADRTADHTMKGEAGVERTEKLGDDMVTWVANGGDMWDIYHSI